MNRENIKKPVDGGGGFGNKIKTINNKKGEKLKFFKCRDLNLFLCMEMQQRPVMKAS